MIFSILYAIYVASIVISIVAAVYDIITGVKDDIRKSKISDNYVPEWKYIDVFLAALLTIAPIANTAFVIYLVYNNWSWISDFLSKTIIQKKKKSERI